MGPVATRSGERTHERPFWREALAPYARPHLGRSVLDLATSVVPYLGLLALMYLALDVSYLLVLALAFPPRASCCARTSSSTTARTARSCRPSAPTPGWAPRCGLRGLRAVSRAGATATPSTTPPPATSTGAASATSPR